MNYRTRTQAAEETLAAERAKRIFDAAPEMLELLRDIRDGIDMRNPTHQEHSIHAQITDLIARVEAQS